MLFQVDFHSAKAVYRQLMSQVKFAVATGRLKPGEKLPPIRDVAVEVRVNRNTVAKVYQELEREGIVYTRPGQGCFVSDRESALSREVREEQLLEHLDDFLAQARLFSFSRQEVVDLIMARLDVVYGRESEVSQ